MSAAVQVFGPMGLRDIRITPGSAFHSASRPALVTKHQPSEPSRRQPFLPACTRPEYRRSEAANDGPAGLGLGEAARDARI